MNGYGGENGYDNGNGGQWGEMSAAQKALKDCGSSAWFFAAAAGYTASSVIYAFTNLGPGAWLFGKDYHTLFQSVNLVMTLMSMVQLVVFVLICVGMWMFFAGCKGARPVSAGSLTAVKVGICINLILGVVSCLFSAGVMIWILVETGHAGRHLAQGRAALLGMVIGMLILTVLLIVYYGKALKCAGAAQEICREGWPKKKLPVSLAVMNFILAGFIALGLLGLSTQEDPGRLYLAGQICQLLSLICVSVCILKLRERLILGN
ncbi:MAG: hypothetical protein HFI67_02875 [Lachnospiraceae bacterium]|jgi:hypothetical protein|nr:hypothetical protein [Lachnospiraceae bacterium]